MLTFTLQHGTTLGRREMCFDMFGSLDKEGQFPRSQSKDGDSEFALNIISVTPRRVSLMKKAGSGLLL